MWTKGVRYAVQCALVSSIAVCCLIPMGYLLVGSVRDRGAFSLVQYEDILLYTKEFFTWFWNSVLYTAAILALCVPIALLAAFGLTQYRFHGRNALLFLYTLLMLLPFQATVVAQHLLLNTLGLHSAIRLRRVRDLSAGPVPAGAGSGNRRGSAVGWRGLVPNIDADRCAIV